MRLAQRYHGAKLILLIVPEHTTTKKGWMARYKHQVPHYNDTIFRVITQNSDVLEQVRKINSHFKNVIFVNDPLENSELTYGEVLRELRNKRIFPNGTHLFRYKKPLHIFDIELSKWNAKKEKYLSCS